MEQLSPSAAEILALGQRVVAAEIDLDQFYTRRPDLDSEPPLIRVIAEDVEDALIHTPGFFFKEGVNLDVWRVSDARWKVVVDMEILLQLQNGADLAALEVARRAVIDRFGSAADEDVARLVCENL